MTQMPAFCGPIEQFWSGFGFRDAVLDRNCGGQLKEIWLWSYFSCGGIFIFRAVVVR